MTAPEVARRLREFLAASADRISQRIFVRTTHPRWPRSRALQEQYARTALQRTVRPDLSQWYGVAPDEGDVVIDKHWYSAFVGTPLDAVLRANRTESIILAGVTTDVCVDSTARDAFMRDYGVVILSDCTQATTPGRKQHTLEILDTFFGRVHTSTEVLSALPAAPAE